MLEFSYKGRGPNFQKSLRSTHLHTGVGYTIFQHRYNFHNFPYQLEVTFARYITRNVSMKFSTTIRIISGVNFIFCLSATFVNNIPSHLPIFDPGFWTIVRSKTSTNLYTIKWTQTDPHGIFFG